MADEHTIPRGGRGQGPSATTPTTTTTSNTPAGVTETAGAVDPGWSGARRTVFRVYSAVVALLVLALFSFGLLEVLVMWLPDETVASMDSGEYPGGMLAHRSHFMAIGLVAWTIVPAVLVQLRAPWRRLAPMQVLVVMAVAGAAAFGLHGSLGDWVVEDLVLTVLLLVLAVLHPRARDVFRRPGFHRPSLGWAAVGTVPWAVYALGQAELQFDPAPGDIHAGEEHWAIACMMAVAIITCAWTGASDNDGWRLPAWTAALVPIVFGLHSLVFPGSASGLSTPWAGAAIAWGVLYGVLVVARLRRTADRTPVPAAAGRRVLGSWERDDRQPVAR